MHILVADDELKTRTYLSSGLSEAGFTVDTADDGGVALTLLREHAFDVCILDVMLPGRDGWSVLSTLRKEGNETKILFLTAKGHVEDRVRGFELGGNDYLVKPFAFAELVARIKNLGRLHIGQSETSLFQVGGLNFDLLRNQVDREGKILSLTPKEYALLLLFARQSGRVLSRRVIMESIWGVCFDVQTNVVDVVMGRLRSKVDATFSKPMLHTVRGIGYMLEE